MRLDWILVSSQQSLLQWSELPGWTKNSPKTWLVGANPAPPSCDPTTQVGMQKENRKNEFHISGPKGGLLQVTAILSWQP